MSAVFEVKLMAERQSVLRDAGFPFFFCRRILVESALSLVNEKLVVNDASCAAENFVVSMLEIFLSHLRLARDKELRRRNGSNEADRDGVPWSNSQDEVGLFLCKPNKGAIAARKILQ